MKTFINKKMLLKNIIHRQISICQIKLMLLILFLFTLSSNAQSFQWGASGGGTDDSPNIDRAEQMKYITTDSEGNVYGITKVSNNGLIINGVSKPDIANSSSFGRSALVSYSCDGAFRWSKIIGQLGGGVGIRAVKIDAQNNVCIAGGASMLYNLQFDSDATQPCSYTASGGITTYQGCKSAFIVKYDMNGNLLWINYPEGTFINNNNNGDYYTNRGYINDLDLDNDGNLYALCSLNEGSFCNGAYVNNVAGELLNGNSGVTTSRHILKFNSQGVFLEGHQMQMPIAQYQLRNVKSVRSKNSGNYYFIAQIDAFVTTFPIVNGEPINKFKNIFAYSNQGQFLWRVESVGNNFTGPFTQVIVDDDENIYICGVTTGTKPNQPVYESFAGEAFYIDEDCNTGGLPIVVKLNPQGIGIYGANPNFESSGSPDRYLTLNGNEIGLGMPIYGLKWENKVFTPTFNSSGAGIVRLDKNTGSVIDINQIAPTVNGGSYTTAITNDHLGNYMVGGGMGGSINVGSSTLVSNGGNTDFLIAKFGTDNCDCQVPTCRFKEAGLQNNAVQFTYQGQAVYDSVTWNFGDMTPTSNVANPLHTYSAPGVYNVCVTATNSCDTFQFCKLVDTTALSTSGFVEDFSVNMEISPNPASSFANITFDTAINNPTFEIFDIAGRLVKHFEPSTLNGKISLPIAEMATGMYVVILKQNGIMKMQKKLLVE